MVRTAGARTAGARTAGVRTAGWRHALRDGVVAVSAAVLAAGFSLSAAGAAAADPSATPGPTPAPTVTGTGGAQAAGGASDGSDSSSASSTGSDTSTSPTTGANQAAAAGDVLDQLAEEYAVGSGGGQLSNLLKMSLRLRAMGFKPSKANLAELAQAMNYRPNQLPLIEALKDTIAYQQKIKAQMEILQQYQQQQANSAVLGGSQMPPGMGQPGMSVQPGGGAVPPSAGAPMMPAPPPTAP